MPLYIYSTNTYVYVCTSAYSALHKQARSLNGEELELPLDVCGGFVVDPVQTAVPLAYLLQLVGGAFPQHVLLNLRTGTGNQHVSRVRY